MKRKSLEGDVCGIARSLDIIGDWWSLLIIRDALAGLRRFGEFQRSLGAAKNILTVRLKALVAQGILETVPASDGGAHLEYVPTEKGRALLPVLVALGQWGSEYLFTPEEPRSVLIDSETKRPVQKLKIQSEDGRTLEPDEILIRRPQQATTDQDRR